MGANDPRGGVNFDSRGMDGKIYKEDHYMLLHTKYESSGPCGFGEEDFVCFSHDAPGELCLNTGSMLGRIYEEDHYTLLHTKYKSSGPCEFGEEEFFLCFTHEPPPPRGGRGPGRGWQDL